MITRFLPLSLSRFSFRSDLIFREEEREGFFQNRTIKSDRSEREICIDKSENEKKKEKRWREKE